MSVQHPEVERTSNPQSSWRAQFAQSEVMQRCRPKESQAYIHNPHRGTTTFQRFNGDALYAPLEWNDAIGPLEFKPFAGNPRDLKNPDYPDTTVSYCRWLWSVIEPEKGKYRWDVIEGALEAARVRGQTLQIRVQPYIGDDLPKFYHDLGGPIDPKADPKRREPDHNSDFYIKHWSEFQAALGAKFDGHPVLESNDIAYGGACGECGGNSTEAIAHKLTDAYRAAFKKTPLVAMLGTFGCRYSAQFKNVGWRSDCYGDMRSGGGNAVPTGLNWNHTLDAYPKEIYVDGVVDRWKTAPVTFETCWTVGYWEKEGWDIDFILEQGLKYHPTFFMPKSNFFPQKWREKLDAWDKRLGYRFVLRQVNLPLEAKPGAAIPYEVYVDNVGVAPIYWPYKLALRFKQGKKSHVVALKHDIRKWLPDWTYLKGEAAFPEKLERGVTEVSIGIVDSKKKPKVRFAIQEVEEDGWHPLTKMDVL